MVGYITSSKHRPFYSSGSISATIETISALEDSEPDPEDWELVSISEEFNHDGESYHLIMSNKLRRNLFQKTTIGT